MTVLKTNISWCDATWNLAVGCNEVSGGCDNCYARTLVERLPTFGHAFHDVRVHLNRLDHVRKFKPIREPDGTLRPHLVFTNSMSDFWHDAIPDAAVNKILDTMEAHPATVFQVLTKRPIRMRRMLAARYGGGRGIPLHLWIGVTAEDDRVAKRLTILRSLKERVGSGTFFASVEPIIGPTETMDFTGVDWVVTGGESGPKARRMERPWLLAAIHAARGAGAAIWHKQSGTIASHPNLDQAPAAWSITRKYAWLVDNGWELLPGEKGGATVDRQTFRERPPVYAAMAGALNGGLV